MMKVHYWNDGRSVMLNRFTKDFDEHFPKGASHFRVGHFAVSVAPDTFASCRFYDNHGIDDPAWNIHPSEEFWASFREMRLSALDKAMLAVAPSHPHYDDLMADIKREREFLG